MIVAVKQSLGSQVAAGAQAGREFSARVLTSLPDDVEVPTPVFLDFGEIEVGTASFLREGVIELRNAIRRRHPNLYPVVANANSIVLDDLLEVVRSKKDTVLVCTLDDEGQVLRWQRVGSLDPKQREAYELVQKYGETDAGELMRLHGGVQHTTAWNNRLSALSALGLVFEVPQGRSKRYRAIAREA